MKFAKSTLQLLTILMLAISCATIKHDSIRIVNKLEKAEFRDLNGRYANNPDDGQGSLFRSLNDREYKLQSFWSNVHYQYGSSSDWKSQIVEVEFLTPNKAVFKLYEGNSLIDKKKIRGKFKDGYFYQRPFIVTMPLIPILFGYNTSRLRIGKTENHLVIDYKWNIWMCFLIAGKSEKGQSSLLFSKR